MPTYESLFEQLTQINIGKVRGPLGHTPMGRLDEGIADAIKSYASKITSGKAANLLVALTSLSK